MRIGLAGDWHQMFYESSDAIRVFADAGVKKVLHVGDFGFGGDTRGINYLNRVQDIANAADVTIYVTPGNHEDYSFLRSVFQSHHEPDKWAKIRGRVRAARRGLCWTWDNRRFVSLGGAGSVDRMWRLDMAARSNKSYWWRGEEITDEDVNEAMLGRGADVMITHEAPYYPAVDERIKGNPLGFPQIDLDWADFNREKLDRAARAIMPKVLVHGHHHFYANELHAWGSDGITALSRIVGLNKEMDPGSLAILDTADLSIERIN